MLYQEKSGNPGYATFWAIFVQKFAGFYDVIAIVAGCVQTVLYCDFFYLYVTKVLKGKRLQLPT
jgi:ER lumen protein retaining receptor